MSGNGREIEAKFYVHDLDRIRNSLRVLGARLVQERVLERNTRFDLPGGALRAKGRVLRLRQDTQARMTYKGGSIKDQGVLSREEIEFVVEDFEKARRLLEALGYQEMVYYEKYRTTYEWDRTLIMLDELPYGNFVEIEGENVESIRALARQLNLDLDASIATSYHSLFEYVRNQLKLEFEDLSFANFQQVKVNAADLGVQVADRPS